MRLDKLLSNMGLGTRSEVRKLITHGNVTVNEEVIKKIGFPVKENTDIVLLRGQPVGFVKNVYIMLNKPQEVISATEDENHKTVIDIVSEKYGNRKLFPVGRLDIDTEGLILITDDGDFSHNLMSPKKHVNKTYFAKVEGTVTEETIELFKKGIVFEDGTLCKPGELKIINISNKHSNVELTITEGKFHQVKRMFAVVDMFVVYLKRISIGRISLDSSLELGEFRELTKEEFEKLKLK